MSHHHTGGGSFKYEACFKDIGIRVRKSDEMEVPEAHPKPELNPKPQTPNPKPQTPNPNKLW